MALRTIPVAAGQWQSPETRHAAGQLSLYANQDFSRYRVSWLMTQGSNFVPATSQAGGES